MPGDTETKKPFFGSKFILIISLLIICAGTWFFSGFIKEITTIYGLVFITILIVSVLSSICFIVLVIAKLIQHEIENHYKLLIKENKKI